MIDRVVQAATGSIVPPSASGTPPEVRANGAATAPDAPRAEAVAQGADPPRSGAGIAAVINALAGLPRHAASTVSFEASMAELRRLAALALPAAEAAAWDGVVRPLDAEGGMRGADAVRHWLRNAGMLLERHLRALLEADPDVPPQRAVADIGPDLRMLIARLQRAGQPPSSAEAINALEPPPADTAAAAASPRSAADAVSERLLAEQLRVAREWLETGAIVFEIPIRLGNRDAGAAVRFRRERTSAGVEPGGGPCTLALQVDSEALGAVQATVRWQGRSCHAAFFVERPEAVTVLEGHLYSLREGLGNVFSKVTLDVALDPVRARRSPPEPPQPPGPGSVVSVRT
jgi:hypothetical protein